MHEKTKLIELHQIRKFIRIKTGNLSKLFGMKFEIYIGTLNLISNSLPNSLSKIYQNTYLYE